MVFTDLSLDRLDTWISAHDLYILYLALGTIIAFYGVSGRYLKFYLFISEPMSSMLIGFFLGRFFDLYGPVLDPGEWFVDANRKEFILHLARLTLAIQLMSTAIRLPRFFVLAAWKQLLILLLPVMFLTMLTGALFSWVLFDSRYEGFGLAEALTVGAMFSPTDPVVAAAALSGKFATKRLSSGCRHLLSAESAANDGLAYLYFSLPLLFATNESTGDVFKYYFAKIVGYEIILGAAIALLIGLITGLLVEFAEKGKVDKESFLAFTIGFSLLVLGLMRIFEMDAIFAVFVAGCGLIATYPHHRLRHEDSSVQETLDSIITCAFFFLLGVIFPFGEIYDLGWRGVVLSLLLIFFRRPLWIFLFYFFLRPYVRSFPGEGFLYSYFAPIGVSSVFYGALASESLRYFRIPFIDIVDADDLSEFFWLISLEVVAFSTFIHGFSGIALTHAVSYFEKHKASFYHFLHLPYPNPLRGKLILPNIEHMVKDERHQYRRRGFGGDLLSTPKQGSFGTPLGVADGNRRRRYPSSNESVGTVDGYNSAAVSENAFPPSAARNVELEDIGSTTQPANAAVITPSNIQIVERADAHAVEGSSTSIQQPQARRKVQSEAAIIPIAVANTIQPAAPRSAPVVSEARFYPKETVFDGTPPPSVQQARRDERGFYPLNTHFDNDDDHHHHAVSDHASRDGSAEDSAGSSGDTERLSRRHRERRRRRRRRHRRSSTSDSDYSPTISQSSEPGIRDACHGVLVGDSLVGILDSFPRCFVADSDYELEPDYST